MKERKVIMGILLLTVAVLIAFGLLLTLFMRSGFFDLHGSAGSAGSFVNMRSSFTAYAEPDFFAQRLGQYPAQRVRVLENLGNGWVQVTSRRGAAWVFTLPHEVHVLERRVAAFESKDDTEYVSLIGPGEVEVIMREGDWMLVSQRDGPLWINPHFMPSFDELLDFFANLPFDISVFYKNLDTGFTFGHRDDVIHASASLNKAIHALYVYQLAEQGLADLSARHVFREADRRGGTGVIQHMPAGTEFTLSELLVHSVRDSDNIAFRIMVDIFYNQVPSYYDFYRNMVGHTELVRNITGHLMTANEMGLIMLNIHNYLESGGTYSHAFKESLLNSDVPIIMSDHPVAQKYGRWDGYFHDASIVYAPSPYILVIMSRLDAGARLDMNGIGAFEEFKEISMFIQQFNDKYFSR